MHARNFAGQNKSGVPIDFRRPVMDTLGLALIVGGTAFLCSGLIFLLPGKAASSARSVEENIGEIENHLEEMRSKRDEY